MGRSILVDGIEQFLEELVPSYKNILLKEPLPVYNGNLMFRNSPINMSEFVEIIQNRPEDSHTSLHGCKSRKGTIYGGLPSSISQRRTRSTKKKLYGNSSQTSQSQPNIP